MLLQSCKSKDSRFTPIFQSGTRSQQIVCVVNLQSLKQNIWQIRAEVLATCSASGCMKLSCEGCSKRWQAMLPWFHRLRFFDFPYHPWCSQSNVSAGCACTGTLREGTRIPVGKRAVVRDDQEITIGLYCDDPFSSIFYET